MDKRSDQNTRHGVAPTAARPGTTLCALAVLGLGMLTLLTTVLGMARHYSPVPFWDQWDGGLAFYLRALQNPATAFFEQHNEHRLVVPNLIFFADVRYFGGRNVFALAANVVLATLEAVVLWHVVMRHVQRNLTNCAVVAGVTLIFTFSFIQRENFTWGFQSQWFAVYLFAICSFHAIERSAQTRSRRWLVAALVSASFSAGCMASGLLALPMLLALAVYFRLPIRVLALIFGMTLLLWAAYFHNWHAPGGASPIEAVMRSPVGIAKYVLLYLGGPLQYTVPRGIAFAYILGSITVILTSTAAWLAVSRSVRPRAIALLGTALFLVGNGAITAAGRYAFGLGSAMSSRYTTAALLAVLCSAAFLWLNASHPNTRRAAGVGLLIGAAWVFTGQYAVRDPAQTEVFGKKLGGLALRWNVFDPVYTAGLFPESALRSIVPAAQKAGLSIFARDSVDYPPLPPSVNAATACKGSIDSVEPTGTPGVYASHGWTLEPSGHRYLRTIFLADADGRVVGEAVTGEHRPDLALATGVRDDFGGWVGFFRGNAQQRLQAFGLLSDGTFCATTGARSR